MAGPLKRALAIQKCSDTQRSPDDECGLKKQFPRESFATATPEYS
jgi:hypothetical protein